MQHNPAVTCARLVKTAQAAARRWNADLNLAALNDNSDDDCGVRDHAQCRTLLLIGFAPVELAGLDTTVWTYGPREVRVTRQGTKNAGLYPLAACREVSGALARPSSYAWPQLTTRALFVGKQGRRLSSRAPFSCGSGLGRLQHIGQTCIRICCGTRCCQP